MKRTESGVKLNWDDFVLFPDDGQRHELIDGEHYVTPIPIRRHQVIVGNLFGMIWCYLRERPLGNVYSAPLDVILSAHDVVEPDVLYVSHERARTFAESPWLKGAPDLVIEVGSPSTKRRDGTIKRRQYEQAGVDEYWLVDLENAGVTVLRRDGGTFGGGLECRLADGDILTTPLLPGLEIALREVFEE